MTTQIVILFFFKSKWLSIHADPLFLDQGWDSPYDLSISNKKYRMIKQNITPEEHALQIKVHASRNMKFRIGSKCSKSSPKGQDHWMCLSCEYLIDEPDKFDQSQDALCSSMRTSSGLSLHNRIRLHAEENLVYPSSNYHENFRSYHEKRINEVPPSFMSTLKLQWLLWTWWMYYTIYEFSQIIKTFFGLIIFTHVKEFYLA